MGSPIPIENIGEAGAEGIVFPAFHISTCQKRVLGNSVNEKEKLTINMGRVSIPLCSRANNPESISIG